MEIKMSELPVSVVAGGVGVLTFCGGLGIGFLLGKRKRLTVYVHEDSPAGADSEGTPDRPVVIDEVVETEEVVTEVVRSEDEIEQDHSIVTTPNPDPSKITVSQESLDRRDALIEEHGDELGMKIWLGTAEPPESEDEKEVVNVFASSGDDDWDYEEELKNRTTEAPYVIHKDEFWAEESGYDQTTLTYFAGDDILVDDRETPIYDYKSVIGELKFGHGSGDPNVFHVRNDRHRAEYEVLRDRGHYSIEVLGLSAEEDAERETSSAPAKFRSDD